MALGLFMIVLSAVIATTTASSPIISAWLTSNNQTGYNGITANVYGISADSTYVYISSNSVPSYTVGPWKANPNVPTAQQVTYK